MPMEFTVNRSEFRTALATASSILFRRDVGHMLMRDRSWQVVRVLKWRTRDRSLWPQPGEADHVGAGGTNGQTVHGGWQTSVRASRRVVERL